MSVATLIPEAEVKIKKPLRRQARTFAKEELSREQLIDSVSSILSGMIQQAGAETPSSDSKPTTSPFHAKKVPSISIRDYLQRFGTHSKCSDSCFIILLIIIDRIAQRDSNFELDALNIHRISLLGLISAAKYQDDVFLKNKWYAEIGGLKLEDLNKLELEFLQNSLNFELYIEESTYNQYQKYCEDYFNKEIKKKRVIKGVSEEERERRKVSV